MNNIFEKILYGLKVANDNIIVLNDKVDSLLKMLSYEDNNEPKGTPAQNDSIGSANN